MMTVSRQQEDYKPSRSLLARVRVLRDVELVLLVELVEVFVGALASRRASLAPRRRFALRRRASHARSSSRPAASRRSSSSSPPPPGRRAWRAWTTLVPSGLTADAVVDELASRVAAAAFFGSGDGARASSSASPAPRAAARARSRRRCAIASTPPPARPSRSSSRWTALPLPARRARRLPGPGRGAQEARRALDLRRRRLRGRGGGGARGPDAVTPVPEFDHEVHDPEPGKIAIEPTHKIVLVEGNYLPLERPSLEEALGPGRGRTRGDDERRGRRPLIIGGRQKALANAKTLKRRRSKRNGALLDETWFVDASLDVAMRRVSARHVAVGRTEAEAKERVDGNDRINGALVIGESRANADVPCPRKRGRPRSDGTTEKATNDPKRRRLFNECVVERTANEPTSAVTAEVADRIGAGSGPDRDRDTF